MQTKVGRGRLIALLHILSAGQLLPSTLDVGSAEVVWTWLLGEPGHANERNVQSALQGRQQQVKNGSGEVPRT
jgi:hypothetical protein